MYVTYWHHYNFSRISKAWPLVVYLRAVIFKCLPYFWLFGRKHWASVCGQWFGSWRSLCTAPHVGPGKRGSPENHCHWDDGKPSPFLAILQQEWAYQSQDAGVLLHILFSSTVLYPRANVDQIRFLVSFPEIAKIQSIYNSSHFAIFRAIVKWIRFFCCSSDMWNSGLYSCAFNWAAERVVERW